MLQRMRIASIQKGKEGGPGAFNGCTLSFTSGQLYLELLTKVGYAFTELFLQSS